MNKILFVIGLAKSGGAEKRGILIASLLKKYYDTKVFAFSGESDGVDYSFAKTYQDYKKQSINNRVNGLREILDSYNPDYVVSFMPHINLLTTFALQKKKYSNIFHVIGITFPKFKFKNNLFLKCSIKKCNAVYYQTEGQKKFIKTSKPSFVLSNPIMIPKQIPSHNETLKFMSVGRLTEQKDFTFLLKVFLEIVKVHPKATLDIYGSGPQKEMLNNYIFENKLSENVSLYEYTPSINDEYLKHNIFLYSSVAEGFPNALAEAMANGLTCFTTYFETGCDELIIDKKTGFICRDRNVETYAKIILDALKNPKALKEIANNGYEHVKELCDSEIFAKRFDAELKRVSGK